MGVLARVGALYHDCGKALNPFFFIENQPPGNLNPHNDIDPEDSAATIIRHVSRWAGAGTQIPPAAPPAGFHSRAPRHRSGELPVYPGSEAGRGNDESKVDAEKFRYPGPRPQSRETALLMLADGAEARMRAERPKDEEELRKLISSIVQARLESGQLDDTDLTLRTCKMVIDSFTATLRGVYHPRIQYPKLGTEVQTVPASRIGQPKPGIDRTYSRNAPMINIESQLDLPVDPALLESAARQTLAYAHAAADLELTLVIGDDSLLQQYNQQYLGIDAPTDVLSFPAEYTDPDTQAQLPGRYSHLPASAPKQQAASGRALPGRGAAAAGRAWRAAPARS